MLGFSLLFKSDVAKCSQLVNQAFLLLIYVMYADRRRRKKQHSIFIFFFPLGCYVELETFFLGLSVTSDRGIVVWN